LFNFNRVNDMSEKIEEIVAVAEVGSALYLLVVGYEEGDGGNGQGFLYRTAGTRESELEPVLSTNDYLRVMWASPSGSIWLSSEDGNVWTTANVKWTKPKDPELSFDSYDARSKWRVTTLPNPDGEDSPPTLGALWGTDDVNVFAAASDGPIFHWNGKAWRQVHRAPGTIRAFSGTAPDNIFAVGEEGALLHFDGVTWHDLVKPDGTQGDELFTGACHGADGSVYICSQDGRLLHGSKAGLAVLAQDEALSLRGLAFLGHRLLLAAGESGVAELRKSALVVARSTFHSTFIAPGKGRLFFLDASTETCYCDYDPAHKDEPWWFVTF
jgi:hypothetical protein